MKYIIDVPDRHLVSLSSGEKQLTIPVSVCTGNNIANKRNVCLPTDFILRPYSELNREAIEDEVWEFVKKMEHEIPVCDLMDIYGDESEIYQNFTYQEAKAKYEAWKKSKEEICVGDEIRHKKDYYSNAIVMYIDSEKSAYFVSKDSGKVGTCTEVDKWWEKTGRHFNSVEDFLKEGE